MISVPKNPNPSPAFKIIDEKGGYKIYVDPIKNKDEADPEQEFVFKNLDSGQYAHASLHCVAFEGEMTCHHSGMHKVPAGIKNWLIDQL